MSPVEKRIAWWLLLVAFLLSPFNADVEIAPLPAIRNLFGFLFRPPQRVGNRGSLASAVVCPDSLLYFVREIKPADCAIESKQLSSASSSVSPIP